MISGFQGSCETTPFEFKELITHIGIHWQKASMQRHV